MRRARRVFEVDTDTTMVENMSKYLSRVDMSMWFTYPGSLTTPTCNEVVTWIVFYDYLDMIARDYERLMELKTGEEDHPYITNNYRPVQPLNGRTVRRNFEDDQMPDQDDMPDSS